MPPRKKPGPVTPPGMTSTRDLHGTMWRAADKLRGSIDAAQYRDFVLSLVFLKYMSDSFAEHRKRIRAEDVSGQGTDALSDDEGGDQRGALRGAGVISVP